MGLLWSDCSQTTLFPECLDDWIGEDNPVRVIDALVESIDLGELGFDGVVPDPPKTAGIRSNARQRRRQTRQADPAKPPHRNRDAVNAPA
jgi:hypothetical protein